METFVNKIACPKCGRQYQVNANLAGKTVKCASCGQSFVVGQTKQPVTAVVPAQTKQPAGSTALTQRKPPAKPKELPADELGNVSKLFPNQLPLGPDPLANHVVDDPGFMEVDVEEIRLQRELEAEKDNKLVDAFSSSSSIDDLDDEKKRKKSGPPNQSYFGGDTLFGMEGRINRKKYWISSLLFAIFLSIGLTGSLIGYALFLDFGMGVRPDQKEDFIYAIPFFGIILVAAILAIWVNVALGVKRYHDLGHSGNRMLFALIPVVGGIIVFIECGLKAGKKGRNKYGPDPLLVPPKPQTPPSQ